MNPQGTKSCSSLVRPVSLELPRLWVLLIDLAFQRLPEVRLERAKFSFPTDNFLKHVQNRLPIENKMKKKLEQIGVPLLPNSLMLRCNNLKFFGQIQVSPRQTFKTLTTFWHLRVSDFCGTSSGAKVQKVKSSSAGPISSGNESWQCYPMLRADPSELYMVHRCLLQQEKDSLIGHLVIVGWLIENPFYNAVEFSLPIFLSLLMLNGFLIDVDCMSQDGDSDIHRFTKSWVPNHPRIESTVPLDDPPKRLQNTMVGWAVNSGLWVFFELRPSCRFRHHTVSDLQLGFFNQISSTVKGKWVFFPCTFS